MELYIGVVEEKLLGWVGTIVFQCDCVLGNRWNKCVGGRCDSVRGIN